jgi:hypothetical protein
MIVKVHNIEGKIVLAICDKDLVGKKFSDSILQLDLSSSFYKGKDMSEKELSSLIKKAHILNIVGDKSVNYAIKKGFVSNVIKIKNIPHAQAVITRE